MGCEHRIEHADTYHVTVRLQRGELHCDSATLIVVDDDYGKLRVMGGARLLDSVLYFTGHTDAPHIAYLDFHTDSLPMQLYFILEPTQIGIALEPGRWLIKGGAGNHSYQVFLNRHARLLAERDSLWRRYIRMGIDSTLTWNGERMALRKDSLLQDSLQRIIVERINRGDLVSRLIKQRLLPSLTHESLERIENRKLSR